MSKKRAALFIDGIFFTKINEFIKGDNENKNVVIKSFISMVVSELEKIESIKLELKQIDFFKGKFSINQLEKLYSNDQNKIAQHLYKERRLEDILAQNNIAVHNQHAIIRRTGELVEKGIDVSITIEALQTFDIDYFILISGDQDFIPLIKFLKRKGIKTATINVDLKGKNNKVVKTSNNILPIYDIVIDLNGILTDEEKLKNLLSFQDEKEKK